MGLGSRHNSVVSSSSESGFDELDTTRDSSTLPRRRPLQNKRRGKPKHMFYCEPTQGALFNPDVGKSDEGLKLNELLPITVGTTVEKTQPDGPLQSSQEVTRKKGEREGTRKKGEREGRGFLGSLENMMGQSVERKREACLALGGNS